MHTEIEVRNAAQRWRHIKMHFKNQAILCRGLFFHDFHDLRRKKKLKKPAGGRSPHLDAADK